LAWQQKEKQRLQDGITSFGENCNRKDAVPSSQTGESDEDLLGRDDGGGFLKDEPAGLQTVKSRAPKIYYATRTHSQIAQVVNELKRTEYKPLMTVLASKQQYCVNTHVRSKPSLEEACEEVLRDGHCQYFKGTQALASNRSWPIHDIEDLAKLGRRRKGCPYYLSRKWSADAELIFGPYNYFLDPVIRRSMSIGTNERLNL